MESITNNAEYLLVDSSSFKLPGSGQYVADRRSVTWHTDGVTPIVASMEQESSSFGCVGKVGLTLLHLD